MESIWDTQISISRRLLLWSGLSVLLGVLLILSGNTFWRGFGIQAVAWGGIDAAIALIGRHNARRKSRAVHSPDQLSQESRKLRRILWINTGLDVLYVVGGILLASIHHSIFWRGHGWGIVLQGGFLLFFDLIHAQSVPPGGIPEPLEAFQGEEHLPFFWEGGKPAALLVHGFPGTPAEMRPLGKSLNESGWTVKGILLPGFGADIATLAERQYEEWVSAIEEALMELRQGHSPILLAGYSMGGALSIIASVRQTPDGLILLSPFWWYASFPKRLMLGLLRPFLPRFFRPSKAADFSDSQVRNAVANFMPKADLEDPEIQNSIRQMIVPISIFDQLRKLSKQVYRKAASVKVTSLVLQGKSDELVKPELTQRLLMRFPQNKKAPSDTPLYIEVDAGHDLINEDNSDWPVLEKAVLNFAESLKSQFEKGNNGNKIDMAEHRP